MQKVQVVAPSLQADELLALLQIVDEALPLPRIREHVERLNVSADAKALIMDVAGITIKVGQQIVAFGRKVISFVIEVVHRFPNSTFGLVIALTVSALIASVPFLGAILSPVLAPLLFSFGLTMGALTDFKEAGVRSRIQGLEQQFAMFNARA